MADGHCPNLVFFPLSLGERENRSHRLSKTTTVSCSRVFGFYKSKQRLFLLPEGEGQDEGERHAIHS